MRIPFAAAVFILATLAGCGETRPSPGAKEASTNEEATSARSTAETEDAQEPQRMEPGAFPAQVAGSFYPSDAVELREIVRGFIDGASSSKLVADRDVVGILSPHAGYRYSGPIAGESYAAVAGRPYKVVVVMALNHRVGARKVALLDRPAYETPLGRAPIAGDVVERLLSEHGDVFEASDKMFRSEHSLEVQLPFIQVALPDAQVLPIIASVGDEALLAEAGRALYSMVGRRSDVLFVMSSDLSHHFSYGEANGLDDETLRLLEEWKLDEWKKVAARTRRGMCGFRPMLVFAAMFEGFERGKRRVTRLDYRNSGDTSGDKASVVGYGSLAFTLEKDMRDTTADTKDFGPYTVELRRELMSLAKAAVAAAAKGEPAPEPDTKNPLLEKDGAAFVTLKKHGDLRGCIGHVIARVPLVECVSDVARAAAIHDHRFSPVTPEELGALRYEISVLTAPEPIAPEDVVVGVHGLIMSRGGRSGLLLPQVPVEWSWGREEFLAHTCRKAGLPLDCWKDPATKIESFRAIVWGEDDL